MKDILIGIDLGTTKLGAVAIDAAQGTLLAVESTLNTAQVSAGVQDARMVIDHAIALLTALTLRPELQDGKVCGLGVTGQMHGVVLVDGNGAPLTNLFTWQDALGSQRLTPGGRSYTEEVAYRLADNAPWRTGGYPASGYGAVTLLRLHEQGLLPAAGTALTIHDALVMALCGRALTDPTDAASWGILDSATGCWLTDLGATIPWLPPFLPEMAPTGSRAGVLLPAVAAQTGLPAGIPVAVALGDNQASFLGSVPSPRASVLINLGTGGQMSTPIDHFVYQAPLETRPFVDGQWLLVGASLCGGRAYQVLESFFAQVGRDLFALPHVDHLYERMNLLAEKASPDCDGLAVSTLFAGSRADPETRGDISGISVQNLTPANLTRAVSLGMIDELLDFYTIAHQAGAQATVLCGAGNAVRRNPLVRDELARRLGLALTMPDHPEEAAVGAAITGGVAAGIFPDWEAAARTVFHAEKPADSGIVQ